MIVLAALAALGCPLAQALHEAGHCAEHARAYERLLGHGATISAPDAPDGDEGHCPICQAFASTTQVVDLPAVIAVPAPCGALVLLQRSWTQCAWSQQRLYRPPARGPPAQRAA